MPGIYVTPEGKSVQVPDEHIEEAERQGLEPAMVMADPKGKSAIVKASHLRQAQESGLVPQQEYDNKVANKKDLDPGALESAGRGFANATTFGFADEIAGAGEAAKTAGKKLLSGSLPSGADLAGGYERGRNEYRNIDDAAWANNKLAYGAGSAAPAVIQGVAGLAGMIGKQAVPTGINILSKTSPLTAAAAQGVVGSAGGGTDAEGQADLFNGETAKFIKQLATGGILGGLFGAGAQKVGGFIGNKLNSLSSSRAAKAVGDESAKAQRNIANLPGGSEAFGHEIQDLGIVGIKGTKAMLDKSEEIRKNSGKVIENTYKQLDALNKEKNFAPKEVVLGTLNKAVNKMDEIVSKLQTDAETRMWSKPAMDYVNELKQDVIEAAKRGTPFTFEELHKKKSNLGKIAFPDSGNANDLKKVFKQFTRAMNDSMQEDATALAQKSGDPRIMAHLAKANRDFSVAITASKALTEKAQREAKNRTISFTDYLAGIAAALGGSAAAGPLGVAAGAAGVGSNYLLRKYGNQAIAGGSKLTSEAIQKSPQLLDYLAAKTGTSIEELLRGN